MPKDSFVFVSEYFVNSCIFLTGGIQSNKNKMLGAEQAATPETGGKVGLIKDFDK